MIPLRKQALVDIRGLDRGKWNAIRLQVIERDDGKCQMCGNIAMHPTVDHIIPLFVEPEKAYDLDNLQTLCKKDHRRKTAEDNIKYASIIIKHEKEREDIIRNKLWKAGIPLRKRAKHKNKLGRMLDQLRMD